MENIDFLKERGVWLSEEKTRILNFELEPLNFLGYTFKYRQNWKPKYGFVKDHIGGPAIAMYPQRHKVKEVIKKVRDIFRRSYNLDSYTLISQLNPIIRGWCNYFNLGNSSMFRDYLRQALYWW